MRDLRIVVAAIAGAGLLMLAGCGSDESKPPPLEFGFGPVSGDISSEVPIKPPGTATAQLVTIKVLPLEGSTPEVEPNERTLPPNFAVRPDLPVEVVIENYTEQEHTFTSPDLGVNQMIPPAAGGSPSVTSFTFTPGRYDVFEWTCVHCGPSMSGKIYAIVSWTA